MLSILRPRLAVVSQTICRGIAVRQMSLYRSKKSTFAFKKPMRPDMHDDSSLLGEDDDEDFEMDEEMDPEAEKADQEDNKELIDTSSAARKKLNRVVRNLAKEPSNELSGEYVDAVIKSFRDNYDPLTSEENANIIQLLLHVHRTSEATKVIREIVENKTITLEIATAIHDKAVALEMTSLAERMARLQEQLQRIEAARAGKLTT